LNPSKNRLQNGFAALQNGFAALQNGFAALQNGFAALQNGFAALQNGFADLQCRIANQLGHKVNRLSRKANLLFPIVSLRNPLVSPHWLYPRLQELLFLSCYEVNQNLRKCKALFSRIAKNFLTKPQSKLIFEGKLAFLAGVALSQACLSHN